MSDQREGRKELLYCAYFANPNGSSPREKFPMATFYADASDDDKAAKKLCARMSVPDKKELVALFRYDTSKMMPTIVADFFDVPPEGEPLSDQEKSEIWLRHVTNLDSPLKNRMHHSRVKKTKRALVH